MIFDSFEKQTSSYKKFCDLVVKEAKLMNEEELDILNPDQHTVRLQN
jgi:hypothetical protein